MSSPECPGRDRILAYLSAELSDEDTQRVGDHLADCADCETVADELDSRSDDLLRSLRQPVAADAYQDEPECARLMARADSTEAAALAAGREGPAGIAVAPGTSDSAAQDVPLGKFDKYQLLAKLGEGGMGVVYKARHTDLDKIVAIKMLPASRVQKEQAVARFQRETKVAGKLEHPNLVRAMDAGQAEGTHFLAMEFVEGLELSEIVRGCGPLPLADACEIIRQTAQGLQHIHQHGLVHRDIKPSNLMLTRPANGGRQPSGDSGDSRVSADQPADAGRSPLPVVKILDLGLALLRSDQSGDDEMTNSGQVMGTADYMAPEQVSHSHDVDIRADIYSLGCTLYKLLSGRAPFAGPEHRGPYQKMTAHLDQPAPSIQDSRPDVPQPLADVLDRMIAKDAGDRYATPAEVVEAIHPFTEGADLAALFTRAQETSQATHDTAEFSQSTDNYRSSALIATDSDPRPKPRPATQPAAGRRNRRKVAIGLLTLAVGLILAAAITIRIIKDGKETIVQAPPGSTTEVKPDGSVTVTVPSDEPKHPLVQPPKERTEPASVKITPEPLEIKPGQPLSKLALVTNPAPIEGVRSWSIETIGHRDAVYSVEYSPDGRFLATACADGAIRLWDSTTWDLKKVLLGHDKAVRVVRWSTDSKLLVSGGDDSTIRIWDVESGLQLRAIQAGSESVLTASLSSDGVTLATVNGTGALSLWNIRSGQRLSIPDGLFEAVLQDAAFSPNDAKFATMSGADVRIWDLQSGDLIRTLTMEHAGHPVPASRLLAWFSDDRRLGATVRRGSKTHLWDTENGFLIDECDVGLTHGLAVAPSGERMLRFVNAYECAVRLYDVNNDKLEPVTLPKNENYGFRSTRYGRDVIHDVTWSHDSGKFAFSTWIGHIQVHEASSRRLLVTLPAHTARAQAVDFAPDGKSLACGNSYATAGLWDTLSGQFLAELDCRATVMGRYQVSGLAWSSDSVKLLTLSCGGNMIFSWNAKSGKLFNSWNTGVAVARHNFAVSPDGAALLLGGDRLWDTATGDMLHEFDWRVKNAAWSPDGELLAVQKDRDPEIVILDAESGEPIRVIKRLETPTASCPLAWSPNGGILASGGSSFNGVCLYDVQTGARLSITLHDPAGHQSEVEWLRWLTDGQTLASASSTEICLWNAKSGKLIRTLPCQRGVVSHDGRLAATQDGASMARLLSLDDGHLIYTLLSLRDQKHAALSPAGHYRGSEDVAGEFVYVVQTDEGQETLTPEQFKEIYKWKNDPEQVATITSDSSAPTATLEPPTTPPANIDATEPAPTPIKITPEPLEIQPGEPLSQLALIPNPAPVRDVRSWTIETRGHRDAVYSVEYSPDGRLLATACADGVIRLWDAVTYDFVKALVGHNDAVKLVRWAPNNRLLVSAGDDKSVRLWDTQSGLLLRTLDELDEPVVAIEWAPNGRILAEVDVADVLRFRDVQSGKTLPLPPGLAEAKVEYAAWSPAGDKLATLYGPTVNIRDAKTGRLLHSKRMIESHSPAFRHRSRLLSWSADGTKLASARFFLPINGSLFQGIPAAQIWDTQTGRLEQQLGSIPSSNNTIAVSISPDKQSVLTVWNTWGACAQRLDVHPSERSNYKVLPPMSGTIMCDAACSPGWERFAAASEGGCVQICDASTGRRMQRLPWHSSRILSAAFSHDGLALATGDKRGAARVWDIAAATIRNELVHGREYEKDHLEVKALDLSPDGRKLFTHMRREQIRTWDIATGEKIGEWHWPGQGYWSPDGKHAIEVRPSVPSQLWSTETGEVVRTIAWRAKAAAWSPDNKLVALQHPEVEEIRLFDVASGKMARAMRRPDPPKSACPLAWSPDGKTLASGASAYNGVYLFDAELGKLLPVTLRDPKAHQHEVERLEWLTDSQTLVSASSTEICLWNAKSGELIRTIPCQHGVCSPKSRLTASQLGASMTRLRSLDDGHLIYTLLSLRDKQFAMLSADGHYRGSEGVENELVYVVQTAHGQETLSPAAFAAKYKLTNDPGRVEMVRTD